MSKKVLVISSSPRRGGNSDLLCDEFVRGVGEHEVKKVTLKGKNINYCTGCLVCSSGKPCVQKDDMGEILADMIASDVIVMATPVYFYAMCGQLKTLIDRVCAGYTRMKNKEFYFLMSAADTNMRAVEMTMDGFKAFLYCLDGSKLKGAVYATGVQKVGDVKSTNAFMQAYKLGQSI